jgi:hypothetical protein
MSSAARVSFSRRASVLLAAILSVRTTIASLHTQTHRCWKRAYGIEFRGGDEVTRVIQEEIGSLRGLQHSSALRRGDLHSQVYTRPPTGGPEAHRTEVIRSSK